MTSNSLTPESPERLRRLLLELCRLPQETGWLEFKQSNSNPEEIGEYVSALSNSAALHGKACGYLVWGVNDATHAVVGTNFHVTQAKQGNEDLENWLLRLLTPRLSLRSFEFEYEGKLVSILEIPRALHQPVRFKSQEFIRIGSYKKALKDYPEVERDLWRVFEQTSFEEQVAAARLTGAAVLDLLDYPAYFRMLKRPLPEGRESILSCLADEQMIERTQDGSWNVRNLGAVLFAHDLSKFPGLKRKPVRVIEYRRSSRVETIRELERTSGYAVGFEELISTITTLLPSNEVIGQALRTEVPMYPELALRELVANALIHQDFTMTGTGPLIELFPDRMEITNPGKPLVEPDRFVDKPPQSRNEALASFLRRVGICEERGSGIDKVVWQTEVYQLPAPLFEVTDEHTRAVLFAHRPFGKMGREDRVRACYLHACLQYVNREDMNNSTLRERFGIAEENRAQVTRVLNDTLDRGLIRPREPDNPSRKYAKYIPYWA